MRTALPARRWDSASTARGAPSDVQRADHPPEWETGRGAERLRERAELCQVVERELAEDRFAACGQADDHLSVIAGMPLASHEAAGDEPVDQLDGAVVAHLETLRDRADRREPPSRQALHGEEELVALRLEAGGARRALAEPEEAADLVAELGERPVRDEGGCRGAPSPGRRTHRASVAHVAASLPETLATPGALR